MSIQITEPNYNESPEGLKYELNLRATRQKDNLCSFALSYINHLELELDEVGSDKYRIKKNIEERIKNKKAILQLCKVNGGNGDHYKESIKDLEGLLLNIQ